jgi:site-specific DNA-methyltransferase (adenine-specific)
MASPEPTPEDVLADEIDLAPVVRAEAVAWLGDQLASSAQAIILDPPYSVRTASSYRSREDGAAGSVYGPFRLMGQAMAHTRRVLAPGCCAVVFSDWRRMSDLAYLASLHGLRSAACVAWTKTQIGTGGLFRSAWDPILVLSAGNPRVPDRSAIPNVVTANKPRGGHPYAKPVEVFHHILGRICLPGELVLDPFAGSAASRDACAALGLSWAGCDIDPDYAGA